MKCSKCQFENSDGAKFCNECGGKLELVCPGCGKANPPTSKFCNECGQPLAQPAAQPPKDLTFDEKLAKIQRYLPEGLTQKILSQRDRIEGERKQVTVMFCDMEGFTPLAERLGPEGIYSLMDQVYEILIHKVNAFGGTVNELTGDGIMALFGAPIALEDAPQRAIRSGLAIHNEITRFSERMAREKGITPLRMRVGIHSGPVVVGTVGNDLRVEFKALGDTVNLASRMESMAEAGTIWVTEDTFKLTEGLFRFEALGEREVKGKEKPVKVFRVLAPSSRKTRFDVSAERGLTPFVGRERELELLLDGFGRAKEGMGQVYSIVGEAGVGKSRFLYEFRKAVSNENVTLLEGKCLSYGKATPYHPIVDVLKANFEIGEDDDDAGIRDKVTRGLKALAADEASTLPYLLELLSVKDSGIDKIPMSPEGRKMRIIEALIRIVIKGSEIRPLILAVEDLHWMDKSSEEAFKWLLEAIPGAKVMLVFTYRPEYSQPWESRSFHNQINLNRLSNRESLVMVSPLLGTGDIDPGLQKLIVTKTEGVPFFIEEFVKSLQDLKAIRKEDGRVYLEGDLQSNAVPSTIQDMIMARVDRLPDPAKSVLQAGSVIEREFSHELIGKVTRHPDPELLAHLSALKDAELLYERGIYPQTSYIFRHALTREVVYNSILATRRKELHEATGQAIAELNRDDLSDHYATLARHYLISENCENAAEFSRLAARQAEKSASIPAAIAFTDQRIACLERMTMTEEVQKILIDARTGLGLYLLQRKQSEAKSAIDPILDLAIRLDYKKRVGQLYTILGTHYSVVEEDRRAASEAFEHALSLCEQTGDVITQVFASYYYATALGYDCQFEKASNYFKKSLDINIAAGSLWGESTMKSTYSWSCLVRQGKIKQALDTTRDAIQLAERSGDGYSKGTAHTIHGVALYSAGELQEAREYMFKGLEWADIIPFYWYGAVQIQLGMVNDDIGDFEGGQKCYREGIAALEGNGLAPSIVNAAKAAMAKSKAMAGEAASDTKNPSHFAEKNRFTAFESMISRYVGEFFLYTDVRHTTEAEHWIRRAIESGQKNGTIIDCGRAYASYAEIFGREGNRTNAQENLGKAIEIMRQCGADGWVEKYERELATIQ